MRCVPFENFFSSDSKAKSFNAISLVVIRAIVTDLDITGVIISLIAFSRAWATINFILKSGVKYYPKMI